MLQTAAASWFKIYTNLRILTILKNKRNDRSENFSCFNRICGTQTRLGLYSHLIHVMKNLLVQLRDLGMIAQVSNEDELAQHLSSGVRTVYAGFDPTSDSLQIGNLVPLLALRRFQLAGHRPVLLVGGATGLIGDPGGRDSERELKPAEEVREYVAGIRQQASRFLDFDCGENAAIVVNNMDWTENLGVIEFLRDSENTSASTR